MTPEEYDRLRKAQAARSAEQPERDAAVAEVRDAEKVEFRPPTEDAPATATDLSTGTIEKLYAPESTYEKLRRMTIDKLMGEK